MIRRLRTWLSVLVLAAGGLLGASALAQQDQGGDDQGNAPPSNRIALVIGNADYQSGALPTTANDAGLVAQTLTQAGFDVTAMGNTDGDTLRKTFRDFLKKVQDAGPDATTLVYLSGYGMQYDGDNFFVPIDAQIARDTDIPVQAVRLSDFAQAIEAKPGKGHLFIYDLARENDFAKDSKIAGGLAQVQAPDGSLYAFNAGPGTVAVNDAAPYGFYAKALSEMIQSPGLPMDTLFDQVRLRVTELTNGAVIPWDDNKLGGDLMFFPPVQGEAAAAPPPAPDRSAPISSLPVASAYTAAVSRDRLQDYQAFVQTYPKDPLAGRVRTIIAARRESQTWSQSYGNNSARAYWTYMRRYPDGPHFADARRRLAILRQPLEPPPRFEVYDYRDLSPPPPEEYAYFRRRYVVFDGPDYAPIPPPPLEYLPRRRIAFYEELPPPPLVPVGFLPIPVPVPLPFVYDRQRYRDRYYESGYIAQPFVPGYGRIVARNRYEPGGGSTVTIISNREVISRTVVTVERDQRTIIQTGANDRVISRTVGSREGRDGYNIVQTGGNGTVLTRTVTREATGGRRETTLYNGDNQVISTVQRGNNGINTQITRGRTPPPVFRPARDSFGGPGAGASPGGPGRGGPNGVAPGQRSGPNDTDTRPAGNPRDNDAGAPGRRNALPGQPGGPNTLPGRNGEPNGRPGDDVNPGPGRKNTLPGQPGGPNGLPGREPNGRPGNDNDVAPGPGRKNTPPGQPGGPNGRTGPRDDDAGAPGRRNALPGQPGGPNTPPGRAGEPNGRPGTDNDVTPGAPGRKNALPGQPGGQKGRPGVEPNGRPGPGPRDDDAGTPGRKNSLPGQPGGPKNLPGRPGEPNGRPGAGPGDTDAATGGRKTTPPGEPKGRPGSRDDDATPPGRKNALPGQPGGPKGRPAGPRDDDAGPPGRKATPPGSGREPDEKRAAPGRAKAPDAGGPEPRGGPKNPPGEPAGRRGGGDADRPPKADRPARADKPQREPGATRDGGARPDRDGPPAKKAGGGPKAGGDDAPRGAGRPSARPGGGEPGGPGNGRGPRPGGGPGREP